MIAVGVVVGIGLGLYILTDLMAALYMTVIAIGLLPFATLPVKIALVPTIIDVALGSFLLVYLFQWMTGKRADSPFRLVPAHLLIFIFVLFTIFCFVAGLGHAQLTPSVLRKFVELVLAILLAIVLTDIARDEKTLRRIALALIVVGGVQALIGLALYRINADTAERLLIALSRVGYPNGNVIRYINDDPTLAERAIGTWVDPNAYGGFLMMIGALAGVQTLSSKPVLPRWTAGLVFALIVAVIWFTQSRGALTALGGVAVFIAAIRYRWLFVVMLLAVLALVFLPFAQTYVDRYVQGLTGQDLSTQMRLGEIKDALTLVGRYPIIGVGFAGAPDRDIYLGVSMLYLKVAGATGLVGLALFLLTIVEIFRYGLFRVGKLMRSPSLFSLWLGFAAGLFGALVSGIFDHYYFNIDFNAAAIMFWSFAGLSLAAAYCADHAADELDTVKMKENRTSSDAATITATIRP